MSESVALGRPLKQTKFSVDSRQVCSAGRWSHLYEVLAMLGNFGNETEHFMETASLH